VEEEAEEGETAVAKMVTSMEDAREAEGMVAATQDLP
jgi:hypothetical protein